MRTLILAAAAIALSTSAFAAEIVTKETEAGVYSSPTAGATPQARDYPSEDTTILEKRTRTTVEQVPNTTVIERRAEPEVEVRTKIAE